MFIQKIQILISLHIEKNGKKTHYKKLQNIPPLKQQIKTPRLNDKELKRPRESVLPTISGLKAVGFKVFKRRKSMHIEEESLEGINSEEHATIVL